MNDKSTVILGLGSNVGDRKGHLGRAVKNLSAVLHDIRCSRVVESQAVLPKDAPPEWDKPYLNMAVRGLTNLSAPALLGTLKEIEQQGGRLSRGIWGPREIDIDILAIGDHVIKEQDITIPHRELLNRDFALLPLLDVAPNWHYPAEGEYYGWRAADIAAHKGYSLGAGLRVYD
jgi:2-amino-4-hydroxy-6-hydroxymethyldihydropteridine diphosphokinase/dihydropteroate synthase